MTFLKQVLYNAVFMLMCMYFPVQLNDLEVTHLPSEHSKLKKKMSRAHIMELPDVTDNERKRVITGRNCDGLVKNTSPQRTAKFNPA